MPLGGEEVSSRLRLSLRHLNCQPSELTEEEDAALDGTERLSAVEEKHEASVPGIAEAEDFDAEEENTAVTP